MTAEEAATTAKTVYLDSAPVIYAVERFSQYAGKVDPFFDRIGRGELIAFASPITLSECLVMPIKMGNVQLRQGYSDFFAGPPGATIIPITAALAEVAAELRVKYHLHLLDAYQVAAAIRSQADIFLVNDAIFRRVTEVNVVMVDDLDELVIDELEEAVDDVPPDPEAVNEPK
jgi:predicted nucleic acid-binding protein